MGLSHNGQFIIKNAYQCRVNSNTLVIVGNSNINSGLSLASYFPWMTIWKLKFQIYLKHSPDGCHIKFYPHMPIWWIGKCQLHYCVRSSLGTLKLSYMPQCFVMVSHMFRALAISLWKEMLCLNFPFGSGCLTISFSYGN